MTCTTLNVDGLPAIICTGKIRYPRNAAHCEQRGCKRLAQYLCEGCDTLVCSHHGVAASEEHQYCLKCATAAGVAGAQQDLFAKRPTNHDQRITR